MSIKINYSISYKSWVLVLSLLFSNLVFFCKQYMLSHKNIAHFNSTLFAKEKVINSASKNRFAGNNLISKSKCKPHGQYLESIFI